MMLLSQFYKYLPDISF